VNDSLLLPNFVGLSGYARTGKDTVADILVEEFGYRRITFADRLKNFIAAVFPEVAARVDAVGWEEAKEQLEVRRALQVVGRAAKKHIHPDVWIISALGDMSDYDGERLVITDVRFFNEADVVTDRNGMMLRICRNGVGPANDDESEVSMDRYDRYFSVVHNDGSIEDLRSRVHENLAEWSTLHSANEVRH